MVEEVWTVGLDGKIEIVHYACRVVIKLFKVTRGHFVSPVFIHELWPHKATESFGLCSTNDVLRLSTPQPSITRTIYTCSSKKYIYINRVYWWKNEKNTRNVTNRVGCRTTHFTPRVERICSSAKPFKRCGIREVAEQSEWSFIVF